MSEQVFRIEIPIETIDLTDKGALDKIDDNLTKILKGVKDLKVSSTQATDGMATGAKAAAAGMKTAGAAVDDAGKKTDAFEKRLQKTNKSLRAMFKEKFKLVMEAVDKASPILKKISDTAKGLVSKAWRVTVTLLDKVTAPFRSLYRMITSPISIALSVAGLGLGARDTVAGWIDFEKGMSAVRALTGATNEEFKQLSQTAKDLGASTVFSASEVSLGMQYLALAGWQVNEVVAAMPGLLDMAAAGGADLATASDIVATVMRAMKIEASEASRVADIFAKTATSSATNIDLMGETLKYAAPIAQSFGLSLEEVAALTGKMADTGIKGSMAGTAIRSSLLSMATPTKAAAKLMKELDLSFANTDGTMKDMAVIIRDLETSFSKLTKEQRLNAAETLFGTYASSAWLGVIEQGADSYESFQKSLEGSAGAADEMAKTRLDNLAGDIEELSGAFETLQLELMEKLNPYFRQFVQWITDKVPAIQERLLAFTDRAIAKIKEVTAHISSVFQSDDFKAADGFAEKFFIAWDKIIVEPLLRWWNSGGKEKVLSVVQRIATAAGEMLRGIATGVVAAFTGQEVDFESLNLTGMAKAGAETAKTFVSSFFEGLDIGSIAARIPGIIQAIMRDAAGLLTGNQSGTSLISALLVGKGAFGIGKTVIGGARTISALSGIFSKLRGDLVGVGAAAAKAAIPTQAVATAASTAGAVKSVSVLAGIKSALAAIPGWGWVAAGALTAVGVALKLHNDAQERHKRELLEKSDRAIQAWEDYKQSAQNAMEAVDTVDRIKELQIKISRGGLTDTDISNIRTMLTDLNNADPTIDIVPKLVRAGLTEAEITELRENLTAYGFTADVEAKLKEYGLSETEIATLKVGLAEYKDLQVEVVAKLKEQGLSETEIEGLRTNLKNTQDLTLEVSTILEKGTNWTTDQIDTFIADITGVEGRKIQLDLLLQGAELGEGALSRVQADLDSLKAKIVDVDTSTLEGLEEWKALKEKEVMLKLLLSGGDLTEEEFQEFAKEYKALEDKTLAIKAQLSEEGFKDGEIKRLHELAQMAGQEKLVFNISLQGLDQVERYNEELESLYAKVVELSGGAITQLDVEMGLVTQEVLDRWVAREIQKRENELRDQRTDVVDSRKAIEERANARAAALANQAYQDAGRASVFADRDFMAQLEIDRQTLLSRYKAGEITDEQLFSSGRDLIRQIQERKWTAGEPVNTEALSAAVEQMFGEYVGNIFNRHWEASDIASPFSIALEELTRQSEHWAEQSKQAAEQADIYNTELIKHYQAELGLIAGETFHKTDYDRKSIEEMAAMFGTLDVPGAQLFIDAITKLIALNAQADYLSEDEKTSPQDMTRIAEASVLVAEAKQRISTIQVATPLGSSEEDMKAQAEAVEQINEALEAMNMDKISSFDQIGDALEAIEAVDLTKVDTETLQSALTTLGGVSDDAKRKIDTLRNAIERLDGKTATVTVNTAYNTDGSIAGNASGGIYDGAFLSWVAEDGPEAIIPLGARRRQRGINLWLAAGRALGIGEFAEGGIMAPYGGLIGSMGDDDERPAFMQAPAQTTGGPIQVTVSASPTFQINDASNPQAVMDAIMQHTHELSDMLAVILAERMEEVGSNMPA